MWAVSFLFLLENGCHYMTPGVEEVLWRKSWLVNDGRLEIEDLRLKKDLLIEKSEHVVRCLIEDCVLNWFLIKSCFTMMATPKESQSFINKICFLLFLFSLECILKSSVFSVSFFFVICHKIFNILDE